MSRSHLPSLGLAAVSLAIPTVLFAQQVTAPPAPVADEIVIYQVAPVHRTLPAVNYFQHDGPTEVAFVGVNGNNVSGDARVHGKTGKTAIEVKLKHLPTPASLGPANLTFVLWAISPDGRPSNLGEIVPKDDDAELSVTTSMQAFGLIVTAEPYYAVSQPSDAVVAENQFKKHTAGILQQAEIHYSLVPRTYYHAADNTTAFDPVDTSNTGKHALPLALLEARNARRIALSAGIAQYAPEITAQMQQDLQNAEAQQSGKHRDLKVEVGFARQATERAEDARISTLRKVDKERRHVAEATAAQAIVAQGQAEADAQQARDAAAVANQNAAAASQNAANSREEAAALRARLIAQFSSVLSTTETARGIVMSLNDVLFDTGKATLKSNAQLSLTKVATILSLYPSLRVQVEGYTDSTGGTDLNQRLSEDRANAVSRFLTANGVQEGSVKAKGYGEARPVASNDSTDGRSRNRRVELVVSGSAIGVDTTSPVNLN